MAFKWQHTLCSCRSSLVAVEDNGKLCLASDFFSTLSASFCWPKLKSHMKSLYFLFSFKTCPCGRVEPASACCWLTLNSLCTLHDLHFACALMGVCVYLCLHYIYNKPSHLVKQQAFYNVGDFWSWFFWLNFFPKLLSKSALLLFFFWKTKSQNVMCHCPTWFGLGIFTVLVVWNFLVHSWDKQVI